MADFISSDTSDLWWLRPDRTQNTEIADFARLSIQRQQLQLQRQQQAEAIKDRMERTMIAQRTAQAKADLQKTMELGEGALAETLSKIASDPAPDRWLKPDSYKAFLDVGVRHPGLYGSKPWIGAEAVFQHAQQADEKRREFDTRMAETQAHNLATEERWYDTAAGPIQGVPVMNADGTKNEHYFGVPSATGHGFTIHPIGPAQATAPLSLQDRQLRDKIQSAEKQLNELPGAGKKSETPETKKQREAIQTQIDGWTAEREALTHPKAAAPTTPTTAPGNVDFQGIIDEQMKGYRKPPAPPNPKDREVGLTYETPKGNLKWTGTGWIQP